MALKPRYKTISEMVKNYYQMLNGMEDLNPKDPTLAKPNSKPLVEAKDKVKTITEVKPAVKADVAHMSKYKTEEAVMRSFRVLAGLTEREISPWDPGVVGTTKTVAGMRSQYEMDVDEDE